jgi:hypothetical protein
MPGTRSTGDPHRKAMGRKSIRRKAKIRRKLSLERISRSFDLF